MTRVSLTDFDPREIARYPLTEGALYAGVPRSTLRNWTAKGADRRPILRTPTPDGSQSLCFYNLIEIYVLATLRREYGLSLQSIRHAVRFVENTYPGRHPLATQKFATDGVSLFLQEADGGALVNASRAGQVEVREVVQRYLRRIDHDEHGMARRFFPTGLDRSRAAGKAIVIDPHISFGRPVLRRRFIPVDVILDRFDAGDSLVDLAADFRCPPKSIEAAIRAFHRAA